MKLELRRSSAPKQLNECSHLVCDDHCHPKLGRHFVQSSQEASQRDLSPSQLSSTVVLRPVSVRSDKGKTCGLTHPVAQRMRPFYLAQLSHCDLNLQITLSICHCT